jgi:predicted nucleic acid-binding protein
VILTDAGPLIALIDRGEPDHERCVNTLAELRGPMLTTWPAFTEAMYLLGDAAGWRGQEVLWRLQKRGDLIVELPARLDRVEELMRRYRDLPMDLADATLVALAEERDLGTIFSLDKDFKVYRLARGRAFKVVP